MITTRSGLQAKYLSKSIRLKAHLQDEWNRQRRSVMHALVAVKFRDRYLRKRLLDTGNSHLMEWVKSKEGFWSALTYNGQAGQNILGEILMEVREFIRAHQTVKSGFDVTPGDRAVRDYNQAPAPIENITRCVGNEPSCGRKHHALERCNE